MHCNRLTATCFQLPSVNYQTYEPYGYVLASAGQGGSNYGYAGEWTDATGLQYLRARYYDTGVGRFLTRDTWAGNYNDPLSLNRWAYVQGNPVIFVDPSGMCPENHRGCRNVVNRLEKAYGMTFYWPERKNITFALKLPDEIEKGFCRRLFNGIKESDYRDIDSVIKIWETQPLLDIEEALNDMIQVYGLDKVKNITRDGTFDRADKVFKGNPAFYCDISDCHEGSHNRFDFTEAEYIIVILDGYTNNADKRRKLSIIHEFGDRIHYQIGIEHAEEMEKIFTTNNNPLPSVYASENEKEYFADTFAAYTFQKAKLGSIPRAGVNSLKTIKADIDGNGTIMSLDDYFEKKVVPLIGVP